MIFAIDFFASFSPFGLMKGSYRVLWGERNAINQENFVITWQERKRIRGRKMIWGLFVLPHLREEERRLPLSLLYVCLTKTSSSSSLESHAALDVYKEEKKSSPQKNQLKTMGA